MFPFGIYRFFLHALLDRLEFEQQGGFIADPDLAMLPSVLRDQSYQVASVVVALGSGRFGKYISHLDGAVVLGQSQDPLGEVGVQPWYSL